MKKIIKSILKKISVIIPLKNTILFESIPDFDCNTYPVFEEMLYQNLNEKYKMIWLVNNRNKYKDLKIKNVKFINFNPRTVIQKIYLVYLIISSKGFIFSNRITTKLNKKQIRFFLGHGSLIKKVRGIYEVGDNCDYMLNQSDFFTSINSYEFNIDSNKLICLGCPRNDYLYKTRDVISLLNIKVKFDKVIIWLPTFRQQKTGKKDTKDFFKYGIPILGSEQDFQELNNHLGKLNILILLKPHFAQDLSYIRTKELSNLKFIDDDLLYDNGIHLYELLAQSDALITDYSSVYYDYLLLDKPIGLTIDDIETYSKTRGFVLKNIFDILKGEYIKTTEDLLKFINNIKYNKDIHKEERVKIKNLTNYYQDGKSAKRVAKFIINKLERM